MVAFNLYLGFLAFMMLYTLIVGVRSRDLESLLSFVICFAMLAIILALKAFELYFFLVAFFVFSGLVLIAVSDLGLFFMKPTPWKQLINDFPTYTGIVGMIAILSGVEMWMEANKYWLIFKVFFGLLMTISFITAFVRVIYWNKSGAIITTTLFFAAILYFVSRRHYIQLEGWLLYWIVSVVIQSIILFVWRCAVRLRLANAPNEIGLNEYRR